MSTFPPKDFILTKSTVAGIDVYMPRPPDEKQDEIVDFTCPQCTASTAYSAENGGLTCTYCGYYEPPAQEIVGKEAQEFEFTVKTMERVAHGWGIERKELVCNGCAAHTTFSTNMLTHTCPFCSSNQVVQIKAAQDVLRPRFLVPFETTEDDCRKNTAVWLESSWMTPRGLRKLARSAEYIPIYIPFWTFDADTDATWRAEVAHTRTRTTGVGKNRRTTTHTEWKWESGRAKLNIDDLLVSGTNKISSVLIKQMRGYNLNKMVAYDASFLAGMQAQVYDINLEESWELARTQMRERTKKACKNQATSGRMRNFSMNLDFANESWRYILLPIYLTTYKYDSRSWQVMIHGQTGTVAGQRPVSWKRVWLAIIGSLLPAALLGLAALLIFVLENEQYGTMFGFAAFIALVIALIFSGITLNRATKMDDI